MDYEAPGIPVHTALAATGVAASSSTVHPRPDLFFRLVQGPTAFASLQKVWGRILKALEGTQFFHLYAWHKTLIETMPPSDRLFIVAYDHRGPVGILPFVQVRKELYGVQLRGLEVPTYPFMPLSDIVFAPAKTKGVFPGLFTTFLRDCGIEWDYILVPNVLPDSCAFRVFAPGRPLCCAVASHTCDYIPSIVKYREKARRAKKRLLKAGEFTVTTVREPPELRYHFDLFLNDELNIWRSGETTPAAEPVSPPRFYKSLMGNAVGDGECEIHLLKLDGRCIAALFSLVADDVAYAIKINCDGEYERFAPGWILLDSWLKQTLKDGRTAYLMADTECQSGFGPLTSSVFNLYLFNTTRAGFLVYGLTRAEGFLHSLLLPR
jgi:hypothetical protein